MKGECYFRCVELEAFLGKLSFEEKLNEVRKEITRLFGSIIDGKNHKCQVSEAAECEVCLLVLYIQTSGGG